MFLGTMEEVACPWKVVVLIFAFKEGNDLIMNENDRMIQRIIKKIRRQYIFVSGSDKLFLPNHHFFFLLFLQMSRLLPREIVRILHHPISPQIPPFQILPFLSIDEKINHPLRTLIHDPLHLDAIAQYDYLLFVIDEIKPTDALVYLHELGHEIYQCDAMIGILGKNQDRYVYWEWENDHCRPIGSLCIRTDILPSFFSTMDMKTFVKWLQDDKRYLCACALGFDIPDIGMNHVIPCSEIHYRMRSTLPPRRHVIIPSQESARALAEENDFLYRHVHLHYLSPDTLIITLTLFQDHQNLLFLSLRMQGITVLIPLTPHDWQKSRKRSLCVRWSRPCLKPGLAPSIFNPVVIQNFVGMYDDPILTQKRFYSMCTVIGMLPWMRYEFFQTSRVKTYLNERCPELWPLYESLNVPAYRSDLFRAAYICQNGGLYLDCKMVLFDSLVALLMRDDFFAKDAPDDYVCNGLLYARDAGNLKLRRYLEAMRSNISTRNYGKDPLSVTGPGLLGKFVHRYALQYHRHGDGGGWSDSYMRHLATGQIVIKNSYHGYYQENNYGASEHYNVLWNEKRVYSSEKNCICSVNSS